MKKLLSIIISLVLIFSAVSVTASAADAFEADYEIEFGEKITISVPYYEEENFTYVKFVADETRELVFKSLADSDVSDPYCELYSADGEFLYSADDDVLLNFELTYEFIQGETYYFAVYDYMSDSAVDVALECKHSYEGDTCSLCDYVCDHSTEGRFLSACECGSVFGGFVLDFGEETVTYDGADLYYKFVPEEDGICIVKSHAGEDADPYCELYSADGELLDAADDSAEDYNFTLFYEFSAGETYYFLVYDYSEAAEWKMTLEKAVHTTEDSEEHVLVITEEVEGSCQEMSYSKGLYCPECDIYVAGHEELGYSYHFDFDGDYLCDYCGTELIYNEFPDMDFGEIYDFVFVDIIQRVLSLFEHLIRLGFDLLVNIIGK